MNNYEYIIASLPDIAKDAGKLDVDLLIGKIRGQCSGPDNALIDILLACYEPDRLDKGLYDSAAHCRNAFIRDYLLFDLKLRNTKVEYLNKALGRPVSQDMMPLPDGVGEEFDERPQAEAVLSGNDILAREKGLDDLMWTKAEELVQMHVLDIDIILAFIARIKIADRWNKLDPATGRELFRSLVQEIRNTR